MYMYTYAYTDGRNKHCHCHGHSHRVFILATLPNHQTKREYGCAAVDDEGWKEAVDAKCKEK
jgi:hypothetical protein